jgi:hypothetical protein
VRKRFGAVLSAAGVPHLAFHELRHTFGTQMAAAGAPLRAIQEWMGHAVTRPATLFRYPASEHFASVGAGTGSIGAATGGAEMSGKQRTPQWLATWREKRRRKPPRKVGDRLFGSVDGDSEEKVAQRHTTGGEELAAEDRRYDIKGGAGGGGLM